MTKLLILMLTVFVSVSVVAKEKTQTVKGRVIDFQSHYPLVGVTVMIIGADPVVGCYTDTSGYYKLSNIPLGRVSLRISSIGYEPVEIHNVIVSSGKETVLDFEMVEDILVIEPITVSGEKDKAAPNNEMASVSARSFRTEETGRYAGSLNDVSRMAMNFAGVSGANDARNDIVIRGNSPLGLLWVLEDLSVPNPNHFGALSSTGGPVSMLNNNMLKKSDFLTGAFPAEYGNALSGVFDLKMRNGNDEQHEYMGQTGFNGFELALEGPFSKKSKATYIASYRYSVLGLMDKLGFNLGTGTAVPYYQDLSFKFNLPKTGLGSFSLFGLAGRSNIDLLTSDQDEITDDNQYPFDDLDIYYESEVMVVGLSNLFFLDHRSFLKSTLGASSIRVGNQMDTVFRSPENEVIDIQSYFEEDKKQTKYTVAQKLVRKFNAKSDVSVGYIFDSYDIELAENALSEYATYQRSNFDGRTSLFQAYAQWRYRINKSLTMYPGLHYQYLNLNQTSAVEPRFGLRYRLGENQSLSFAVGKHSQMQALDTYFRETEMPDSFVVQTNRGLDFTTSTHVVFGYDNSLSENLRLKVETYYQALTNIPVERDPSYFSMLNSGADFYVPPKDSLVNQGTGYNVGVEMTLEKYLSNSYYFLLTTSVFDSKYKGSDGIERNTMFNGNYVVNGLVGKEYKLGDYNALAFDLKFTYAGNRRFIPIDLEQSRLVDTTVYLFDQAYNDRFPDYFRSDLKVTYRKESSKHTQEWVLHLQNVTDRKNIYLDRYDVTKNKIRRSYQMGIFPILQYRFLF